VLRRRRKRDVLEQLPDKQRVVLPVELANRADYEEVSEDVASWLRRHAEADAGFLASLEGLGAAERAAAVAERGRATEQRARSAETLVRLGHLSLVAARGKLPMALEWIGDFLESGEKLVVFSRHREIADAVHADVPGAALATGALDADRRAAEVERFQTDEACRLIVCTLDAAGVGLTMTAASNVAFLELAWTPAAHDQAEDRVHRIGQASAVTAWYLLAQRTIDERVTEILDRKRRVVDATSDGAGSGQASTIRELSDWLIGAPA
jgi:SNF2 family DNA or RNA helicase